MVIEVSLDVGGNYLLMGRSNKTLNMQMIIHNVCVQEF